MGLGGGVEGGWDGVVAFRALGREVVKTACPLCWVLFCLHFYCWLFPGKHPFERFGTKNKLRFPLEIVLFFFFLKVPRTLEERSATELHPQPTERFPLEELLMCLD